MTRPAPVWYADEGLDGAVLELTVGPVAHGGHCVARPPEGRVVFVRHALPGERVRAVVTEERKGYLRADAVEILAASPDRVAPPCPWAGTCGGCDFQHVRLDVQRELKAAVVREQLVRVGGLAPDEVAVEVAALPGDGGLGWRTRVAYTVDSTGRAGLLRHRSHEVVPVDRCRIAHPGVQAAPVLDREWSDVDSVEVVASAAGDVTLVGPHGSVLSGPSKVRERAVGREWTVPADSFWQVHPAAADTLATAVVELLAPRPAERAWDLYGGVGLFAAALAPPLDATGRLTVVEADPRAAAAATRNLRDLTTVTVLRSDVERALANPRWRSVDLVVLDPPRTGAGRGVVEAIMARTPRAVAYVACDPAALARDVRTFRDAGWRLTGLRGFDLFPMTHHVECVARLEPPDSP
jgi:tRNA/tmRNA/rRNA uracil-C5-methylase (TrmA/RlmC/RlmD family)